MLPVLQVGPLAIQSPGLILLVGFWAGLSLAEKYTLRRGIAPNLLNKLVFTSLIAGFIGARLTYVLRYPAAFLGSPLSLITLNPGLFDLTGGIVIGVLAGWVYAARRGLEAWQTLDALTPLFIGMGFAFGLANLASGNAFGVPTSLPWGIELWGVRRHPTQIYEMLFAVLLLITLWPGRKQIQDLPSGSYFLIFIALSSTYHLIFELLRGESLLLPGGFRTVQVAAWLLLLISIQLLTKKQKTNSLQPKIQD